MNAGPPLGCLSSDRSAQHSVRDTSRIPRRVRTGLVVQRERALNPRREHDADAALHVFLLAPAVPYLACTLDVERAQA